MPDHVHMLVSNPAKDQRVEFHGISEGQKFLDDF